MMHYNGYVGEVEYDDDAQILHGEVIGIRDVVTFQADSASEVLQTVIDSVDDYLDMCKSEAKSPTSRHRVGSWSVLPLTASPVEHAGQERGKKPERTGRTGAHRSGRPKIKQGSRLIRTGKDEKQRTGRLRFSHSVHPDSVVKGDVPLTVSQNFEPREYRMRATGIQLLATITAVAFTFAANALALTYTTIDHPDNVGQGAVTGISNTIEVGYYRGEYGGSSGFFGFTFNGSGYTTLSNPKANHTLLDPYTVPSGISNGNIVGYYATPPLPGTGTIGYNGFRYDGTTWTDIVDPLAKNFTQAHAIDGAMVVGEYHTGSNVHGFLFDGRNYTTLDDPLSAGLKYTVATGISGSSIVGQYKDAYGDHGFFYNGSSYRSLDDPAAYSGRTYATGISGSNIVGWYVGPNGTKGFLYDGSSYTTIDGPDGTDTQVLGISGNTVVGTYQYLAGRSYGFIASVPEPSASSILLFLFLPLLYRRRRFSRTSINSDAAHAVSSVDLVESQSISLRLRSESPPLRFAGRSGLGRTSEADVPFHPYPDHRTPESMLKKSQHSTVDAAIDLLFLSLALMN